MGKFLVLFLVHLVLICYAYSSKEEFCINLYCDDEDQKAVCGIREEGEGFRLRLFENECELLKYGCNVRDNETYGSINVEYCEKTFLSDSETSSLTHGKVTHSKDIYKVCTEQECLNTDYSVVVCGIREDGDGFRVRLFENNCKLLLFNCQSNTNFTSTDLHICNGVVIAGNETKDTFTNEIGEYEVENKAKDEVRYEVKDGTEYKNQDQMNSTDVNGRIKDPKPVIVVDASMFKSKSINATVDNFFAATHLINMPLKEEMNDTSRRMLVNIFGPSVVFRPAIEIPHNISDDKYHSPTLSSCYHKCPTKCPETYAPVCGKPGMEAREPSIMFQNHCFMDVAQCKMRWEDKSPTAESSMYIEASFMFCLGLEMNTMFSFLPLVRTLQHMGRLKKKGYFRHRLRNLRFPNDVMSRGHKFMG